MTPEAVSEGYDTIEDFEDEPDTPDSSEADAADMPSPSARMC